MYYLIIFSQCCDYKFFKSACMYYISLTYIKARMQMFVDGTVKWKPSVQSYILVYVNSTDLQIWLSRPCGVASDCLLRTRTVYWPSVQTPTWFHQDQSIRPYYGLSSPVNKCLFNDYLIYFVICDIYQWLTSFLDQVFSFIKLRDIKKLQLETCTTRFFQA